MSMSRKPSNLTAANFEMSLIRLRKDLKFIGALVSETKDANGVTFVVRDKIPVGGPGTVRPEDREEIGLFNKRPILGSSRDPQVFATLVKNSIGKVKVLRSDRIKDNHTEVTVVFQFKDNIPDSVPTGNQETNADHTKKLSQLALKFRDRDFETYIKNGETLVVTDSEVFQRTDRLAIPAVERTVDQILRSSGIKGAHRTHAVTVAADTPNSVVVQVYVEIHPEQGYD